MEIGADGVLTGSGRPDAQRMRVVNKGPRTMIQIRKEGGEVMASALLRTGDEAFLKIDQGEQVHAEVRGDAAGP